jgi:PleD family two-component response regulator
MKHTGREIVNIYKDMLIIVNSFKENENIIEDNKVLEKAKDIVTRLGNVLAENRMEVIIKEAQGIEDMLNGELSKYSSCEVFNCIERCLDSMESAAAEAIDSMLEQASAAETERENSLLIIDNDSVVMSILTSRYKSKGYDVFCATSLDEAEEILREKKIRIVLTEFYMPGSTCSDIIKRIGRIDSSVRIIVLSSQKTEDNISAALKSGAADYIVKPFSPVELDLRIEKLLLIR